MNSKGGEFRLGRESTTKRPVKAETIRTAKLQIERKTFTLQLQVNALGLLLRVIEQTRGRTNSIVIPATGLPAFHCALSELLNACRSFQEGSTARGP
jgi:hypothetical protein